MAKTASKKKPAKGKLSGKTVALVGKFGYSDSEREKYEERVKRAGGRLVDAEKADPDYLLVGEGRGGRPPGIVAKLEKRHPAVEVLDLPELARLLAPTTQEVKAEMAAGEIDHDRWEELNDLFQHLDGPPDLSRSNFRGAKLSGAKFSHVVVNGCDFRSANLSYADVSAGDVLERANLDDANLYGAKVNWSEDCRFRGADLQEAWLDEGRHTRADFRRANLTEAQADRTLFDECTFREANLTDAQVEDSTFLGADFIGADLTRLHAVEAKFQQANFTGATLRRADLRKASFKGADLSRADLRDAVLAGADLTGAKVDGADFAGAAFAGATLKRVDTSKAKNFSPPVARTPGPALKAFAKIATASKNFTTSAEIELGKGEYVDLELTSRGGSGRRYTYANSCYRRDEHQAHDRIDTPTVLQGMLNLAERWPNATLRLDSIKVKGAGAVRGKQLQELTLAAWSEAFGIQTDSSEDLIKKKESQAAAVQQLREAMLVELRGGPAGIKKWNARPARDKQQIGAVTGLDFSGTKLAGLVVEYADFRGCRFDRASLKGAKLGSTNLEGASFTRANLERANLDYSECAGNSLEGANLRKASLSMTKLDGASLRDADLTGASLDFAHLLGADLTGAKVTGVNWENAYYNGATKFPAGFTPTADMERVPDPPPPPGAVAPVAPGSLDFPAFVERLAGRIDPGRMANARKMLKAERFQLYSEVKPDSLTGIVRSQSEKERVYACRLAADGSFGCCTQNLKHCGGLRGAICKHLLVLILGLTKAGRLDPAMADAWVDASRAQKPEIDPDEMSEAFLRYKGAEAGQIDWRPTETIPEDFYAM